MAKRIKKDCHNCKADDHEGCLLGYKTEKIIVKGYEGLSGGNKPLEVCPKPRTNQQYLKEVGLD